MSPLPRQLQSLLSLISLMSCKHQRLQTVPLRLAVTAQPHPAIPSSIPSNNLQLQCYMFYLGDQILQPSSPWSIQIKLLQRHRDSWICGYKDLQQHFYQSQSYIRHVALNFSSEAAPHRHSEYQRPELCTHKRKKDLGNLTLTQRFGNIKVKDSAFLTDSGLKQRKL